MQNTEVQLKTPNLLSARELKRDPIHESKWLRLKLITYLHATGTEKTWEVVERTTTPQVNYTSKDTTGFIDAVEIIATLVEKNTNQRSIILIKQYRPPIAKVCVEFPAGLIDYKNNETPEAAALRELTEECGYTGKVISVSPVFSYEPSLTNELGCFVRVEADPTPLHTAFDPDEFIETVIIPLSNLPNYLQECSKNGCMVDGKLLSFSMSCT